MKYFFILGNNKALSLAEVNSFFAGRLQTEFISKNSALFNIEEKIEPDEVIKKLGGTIKIAEFTGKVQSEKELIEKIFQIIKDRNIKGKIKFGISDYSEKINTKKIGLEVKKRLKSEELSCRLVESREKQLSSVVVEQNKLASKGVEIVVFKKDGQILVGQTSAVQDFKGLGKRDYGRPARDDASGMLPPKLAQIMINLTGPVQKNEILLDPFCGSGTVLMEAGLLGYKKIIGSDISAKAVADSRKNIAWLTRKHSLDFETDIFQASAIGIDKILEKNSVDKIITEPYLGPQRGKINIEKTKKELNKLYSESLFSLEKILKPTGKIIMVWPVFNSEKTKTFLSPDIGKLKIKKIPGQDFIKKTPHTQITDRGILYGRPGQKVWREIINLVKS